MARATGRRWSTVRWCPRNPSSSAPKLGTPRNKRFVAYDFWWNGDCVYLSGQTKLKRRDLVLHAASRAEGATRAEELPESYPLLIEGNPWRALTRRPGMADSEVAVYHGHLASLRQVAHEVLNSPELRALAEPSGSPDA